MLLSNLALVTPTVTPTVTPYALRLVGRFLRGLQHVDLVRLGRTLDP